MPHIHSKITTNSTVVKWSIRSTAMAITILTPRSVAVVSFHSCFTVLILVLIVSMMKKNPNQ